MPNDATTRLSLGTQDGDKMDESQVTQAGDGVTVAKRPRVVLAGDASGAAVVDPVAADPGANPYSIPALGMALVDDSPQSYVPTQLRPLSMTTDGRIRVAVAAAQNSPDYFGCDAPDYFGSSFVLKNTPWS